MNRINDGLIVSNTSEIKNLADLKGKSLGHLPASSGRRSRGM